jgi:hypothetical protein
MRPLAFYKKCTGRHPKNFFENKAIRGRGSVLEKNGGPLLYVRNWPMPVAQKVP